MGYFYFDESIRDNGGFIIGAFVYSDEDLTPMVFKQLAVSGLKPGADEVKGCCLQNVRGEHFAARHRLRQVLSRTKVGAVVLPRSNRKTLGDEALLALEKFLSRNSLSDFGHIAFFDEGVAFSKRAIEYFHQNTPSCEVRAKNNSKQVGGIQLADLASHFMGTMLLAEMGVVCKTVKAGKFSGYPADLDVLIEFELWALLRYAFFKASSPKGDLDEEGWTARPIFDVENYGLYLSESCSPELRDAAIRRFGECYLGCIH